MTSKIVVNNIESDSGISSVTFTSDIELGSKNLKSTGIVTATTFVGNLTGNPTGSGANLTSIPAGQLTGTIADARISSSSVTQHVTSFDDTSIRHDISMLALHFADTNNKTAFDLANSTIDQMETAASISTVSTATFDTANEYWKAGTEAEVASGITDFPSNSGLSGTVVLSRLTDDDLTNWAFHTDSSGVGANFVIDLQAQKAITKIRFNTGPGVTNSVIWRVEGSNDNSSFTHTGSSIDLSGRSGWTEIDGFSHNYRYFKFYKTSGAQGGGYHRELEMYEGTMTATGSIISDTYTASSSRTQVAGVLLYRDLYGSATLGTDIKVFYSCNNGSNFTEASSYTLLNMAFKTGVKAVSLGKATCTAGTQIKFKVEWANQSGGSKETAVQGVALQY